LAPAAAAARAIPPAVRSGRCDQEHFPAEAVTPSEPRARNDSQDASGMIPSDIYHQRASECLQLAEGSSDIAERTRWRELALCWLRLSEYAEQFRPAERPLRMA
jgi:hypothetical protein